MLLFDYRLIFLSGGFFILVLLSFGMLFESVFLVSGGFLAHRYGFSSNGRQKRAWDDTYLAER